MLHCKSHALLYEIFAFIYINIYTSSFLINFGNEVSNAYTAFGGDGSAINSH